MTLSNRTALLGLVLLCLALYLPGLTALPPFDQDEALFAQASRQMLETGDFIQIRFQDQARNRKPALSYWLQAASAALAGRPDAIWPYRIPSIVGLIAATLLTYWGGLRLFGREAAVLGAALFATSIMAVVQAHMARADAVLIPVVVAGQIALAAIYLEARAGAPALRWAWVIFWLAQGAAVLIKGPILALTSVLTIAALAATDRDWRWLKHLRALPGLAIAVAIAAPWFIATSMATGGNFIADAIGVDLLPKLLGADEEHGGPPGYYLVTGMIMGWPGSLLIGLAVPFAWRNRRQPAVRFCLAWIVPTWLAYEIVPTKLPHYTLPAYPAIALLMGTALVSLSAPVLATVRRHWIVLLWALVGIGCAAFAIAVPLLLDGRVEPWSIVAAVFALGTVYAVALAWRGAWWRATGLALVGGAVWSAVTLQFVLPQTEAMWLSRRLADAIARSAAAGAPPVAVSGYAEPSVVFLLGTRTRIVGGTEAADHIIDNPGAVGAVTEDTTADFLAQFEKRGAVVRSLDKVTGFDYVWGLWRTLGLYTVQPRAHPP